MSLASDGGLLFESLKVSLFDDIRGNFIRLPSRIIRALETTGKPAQEFGALIKHKGGQFYAGWDGLETHGVHDESQTVQINPVLAQLNGLIDGTLIDLTIKNYDASRTALEVYVDPASSDDWEVIEGNAQFLQDNLLYQTRIVTQGAKLACFINNVQARFTVQKIIPEALQSAKIAADTLIMVAPRQNRKRLVEDTDFQSTTLPVSSKNVVLRNLLWAYDLEGLEVRVPVNVTLHSTFAIVSANKNPVDHPSQKHSDDESKRARSAEKIVVRYEKDTRIPQGHIVLSRYASEALGIDACNGEFIKLESLGKDMMINDIPTVVVREARETSEEGDTLVRIKKILGTSVLTNGLVLPSEDVFIELLDEHGRAIPFFDVNQKGCKWKLAKLKSNLAESFCQFVVEKPATAVAQEELLKDIAKTLTLSFQPSPCTLLYGPSGVGKTRLVESLRYDLQRGSIKHVRYVDCEQFQESLDFSKMKNTLFRLITSCYWYKPSVLILDNAEAIFPYDKEDEEGPGYSSSGKTSTKLCLLFMIELEKVRQKNADILSVLLTAKSKESLNQTLFSKHSIGKSWKLGSPDRDQRASILDYYLQARSLKLSPDLELSTLALETEGYSPRDLSLLSDKLLFEHLSRYEESIDELSLQTFEEAIKDFVPSSLRGIKLQKSTGVKWSDIGGLRGVKDILLETLEWPTKYAPIFAKCPLRLRSGILLYGYPGCGKTLLASAVAQQCGLNFISVKGPEILNKYIGASEQSVREIFERAQAAKPCILFFDEFDSIAPKRGHDSIGVTDRVVNQMLTQMDGAEGLDGVYVLAATSRPDLIDSALLRPGRLDKSLLCGLPDEADRLSIIQAVVASGKLILEEDCNLDVIAEKTNGFSGADLQALCYNASLKAINRTLVDTSLTSDNENLTVNEPSVIVLSKDKKIPALAIERLNHKFKLGYTDSSVMARPDVIIQLADFENAATETKPSISYEEVNKLSNIYRKFANERDGNMPNGEASNEVGGRSTLM
ncbi:LAMI_0G03334g1_1 [Lachancea mirantina]|uniref:Peroxisomal ATPase PEX1 n=1 Tax=Lachancea mirantina TaxID=1230905 RepID=A0A1G4K830_9SACH|nr:LAMI_0G03334g1_1 [Lachancea mirantina]